LKKYPIILMAIVDHNYKCICTDVSGYGKNSDGGIFEASIGYGDAIKTGLEKGGLL
jgi:hypothetical protein